MNYQIANQSIQSNDRNEQSLTRASRSVRVAVVRRAAVSLMEVIFAMSVILVGILGLATILGVASNNAQESLIRDRTEQLVRNLEADVRLQGITGSVNDTPDFYSGNVVAPRFDLAAATALPTSFCLDPWFLTVADTIRSGGANGYDRTVFPCYDERLRPLDDPAAALDTTSSAAWTTVGSLPDAVGDADAMRRLPRIGLGTVVNAKLAAQQAHEKDEINLIRNTEDPGSPPSLFLNRRSGDRSTSRMQGRYSYMVTATSDGQIYRGDLVVFRDREVVIDPIGTFAGTGAGASHNLQPYTSELATETNIPIDNQTYDGERIAWVTSAPDEIIGRGTFTYRMHQSMDPRVSIDDYVCLIRRDYEQPAAGPPVPVATGLNVGWFKIQAIVQTPTLNTATNTFDGELTVIGGRWLFHPVQAYDDKGTATVVDDTNHRPYPDGFQPPGGAAAPEYLAVENPDNRYGTIAVFVRNVVEVRRFP